MELFKICFSLFVLFTGSISINAYLLTEQVTRNVTKELRVNNGGRFGQFGNAHFCGHDAYAIGFRMKIEPYQHGGDDTMLNAIELICQDQDGGFGGELVADEGPWGTWTTVANCQSTDGRTHDFLKAFSLQGSGKDDTEANYAKFYCQDFASQKDRYEMSVQPGHGRFGSYGSWSDTCGPNAAICGLRTKIEPHQGDGDDTALNDVIMYCCTN